MELLLTRDQKNTMLGMGSVKFSLTVKAKLTDEEKAAVKKYKMDDIRIYESVPLDGVKMLGGVSATLIGALSKALNLHFLVKDMVEGKTIEVKDIAEMIAAEEQIKEAARNFHALLKAASSYKGEEVITFD